MTLPAIKWLSLLVVVCPAAMSATVDVNTLGSPSSFTSGAQVNCCGTDPLFGPVSYNSVAAVVTVGVSGLLSKVELQVAGTGVANLTMYLLPVSGGAPATGLGSALASWSVTSPVWSSPGLYPITAVDTSSAGLIFSSGDKFAIVLESSTPNVVTGWGTFGLWGSVTPFDRSNPTAAWDTNVLGSGWDPALRTTMSAVPEPGTLALAGIGLLGMVFRRRRLASLRRTDQAPPGARARPAIQRRTSGTPSEAVSEPSRV
jgi:hypothetical protein